MKLFLSIEQIIYASKEGRFKPTSSPEPSQKRTFDCNQGDLSFPFLSFKYNEFIP